MDHAWAWIFAEIYSMADLKDKAIHFIERAIRDIFINYPFFAKYDPLLENIRNDARFKILMDDLKKK